MRRARSIGAIWALHLALSVASAWGASADTRTGVGTGPAPQDPSGRITVHGAWSRATPPGTTVGVVYFDVTNPGVADSLVGIETTVALRAEMHSTTGVGSMQMRETPTVAVPARGHLLFEPGGLHVMLIGLQRPLREGQRLSLTLVFQRAGRVEVEALVRGLGAEASTHAFEGPAYRLAVWPRAEESPDFKFIDFTGRKRSSFDYRGRLRLVGITSTSVDDYAHHLAALAAE